MERTWIIDGDPVLAETSDELAEAVFEASRILDRVGGVIVMAAQREEVAPDIWQTRQVLFRWNSYMPAKRMEPEAAMSVPEPEDEPSVAAVA